MIRAIIEQRIVVYTDIFKVIDNDHKLLGKATCRPLMILWVTKMRFKAMMIVYFNIHKIVCFHWVLEKKIRIKIKTRIVKEQTLDNHQDDAPFKASKTSPIFTWPRTILLLYVSQIGIKRQYFSWWKMWRRKACHFLLSSWTSAQKNTSITVSHNGKFAWSVEIKKGFILKTLVNKSI